MCVDDGQADVWEGFDCDVPAEEAAQEDSPMRSPTEARPRTPSYSPLPEYDSMLTPALRRELRRFGLKAVPRLKAVKLLTHIQVETSRKRKRQEEEPQSRGGSDEEEEADSLNSSQSSGPDLPEESLLAAAENEEDEEGPESQGTTRRVCGAELASMLAQFLRSDAALQRSVLLYEPLWLEDLHARFKKERSVRCSPADFMDTLDAECVTFRTRARARTNNRGQQGRERKQSQHKA